MKNLNVDRHIVQLPTRGDGLLHFQLKLQKSGKLMEQGHGVRLPMQVSVDQHFRCDFRLDSRTCVVEVNKPGKKQVRI